MAGSIFHVHPLQCIYFCRTHPRAGPPLVTTPTPGLLRSFQHPLLFFNFPNVSFQMKMAALCPPASASSKCNTWPFHCCVATRRNNSFSGSILSFPWLFHLLGFLKLSLCLFKSSSKLNSVLFPIVFTSCPATRIPLTQTLLFWFPFVQMLSALTKQKNWGKCLKSLYWRESGELLKWLTDTACAEHCYLMLHCEPPTPFLFLSVDCSFKGAHTGKV